jgi:hypothetical protein
MTFGFKLFKALTGINLLFSGFFLMLMLMALLSGNIQFLIFIILLGAVFVHCILSMYLQKSLTDKSFTLKPNTPLGIQVMGSIAIVYGVLLVAGYVSFWINESALLAEIQKSIDQMPAEQRKEITPEILHSAVKSIMTIVCIIGCSIVNNATLSFTFLKQWKERENTPDIDINEES